VDFVVGQRVRLLADVNEIGVIDATYDSDIYTVQFPDRRVDVHGEDLASVNGSNEPDWTPGNSIIHLFRQRARYLQHAFEFDSASSIGSARVDPQLHQMLAAYRVTRKSAPRMILADEVGMGKTIEAGLIIKELRARGAIDRVLILAPASLTRQWQSEMLNKFNEDFTIFDGPTVKLLSQSGANAWMRRKSIVASLQYALNRTRFDAIFEADWDLIIIDEAHKLNKRTTKTSIAYDLVDQIKMESRGLLLLTATPLQLELFQLYSLINLVEPGLFRTFQDYQAVAADLPQMNVLMRDLIIWNQMSSEQRARFLNSNQKLFEELGLPFPAIESIDVSDYLDSLSQKHPLSEVMVRNRKSQIGILSERRATKVPIQMSQSEKDVYLAVEQYLRNCLSLAHKDKRQNIGFLISSYYRMLTSSSVALKNSMLKRADSLRLQLAKLQYQKLVSVTNDELADFTSQEELELFEAIPLNPIEDDVRVEIEWLEKLANQLSEIRDSKVAVFRETIAKILAEKPEAKILVFTQYIGTQKFLTEILEKFDRLKVAVFNGQMSGEEKERQIAAYRNSANVLISTEAGGEGRNLQFGHHLINYDLPWNPMRIEQRIGRVDRIGQKFPVEIFNLYYQDTIEERIFQILDSRIGLFEATVGALDPILGDLESDIRSILSADSSEPENDLEQLGENLERKIQEARASEELTADFMMDRSSLRNDSVNALLQRKPMASPELVREFLGDSLPEFGGLISPHNDGGEEVLLTEQFQRKIQSPVRTLRGTFRYELAAEREDLEFLSMGHPLIRSSVRYIADIEVNGIPCRQSTDLPDGVYLEVVARVKTSGFVPEAQLVRVVSDDRKIVFAGEVSNVNLEGPPKQLTVLPDWLSDSYETLLIELRGLFSRLRNEQIERFESIRRGEEERAERYFAQIDSRLLSKIENEKSWLVENEHSVSEQIQKIYPARKGRLRAFELELEQASLKRDDRIEEILNRKPQVELEFLWVSVVEGNGTDG
jgi:ERCC4-related helicase